MVRVEHYGTPIWKTIGKPCRTTIAGWWWLEPWMDYDVRIPFRKGNLLENPKWRFAIFFRGVDVSPPTSHRWVPMTSSRSSGWDRSDDGSKISPCADMIGPIGQRLRKELSIQKLLTYIYIYILLYIALYMNMNIYILTIIDQMWGLIHILLFESEGYHPGPVSCRPGTVQRSQDLMTAGFRPCWVV
jgi:hypothetical protein